MYAPRSWHLGVAVFLLLIPSVQGQITWFDSGELGAAAAGLGVAHPTGFPLLCILGYALQLIPLGPVPFKLALLCAASVAAATALIHATAVGQGARPWPAALGALFFPSVGVVWLHGTVIEVYALNTGLLALLAWLLLTPASRLEGRVGSDPTAAGEPRWRLAALLTGLGLGAHATFALLGAVLWVVALTRHRAWRRLPPWVGIGVLGALVILYLPAAASRSPWLNWGDPSSAAGLWSHLTAAGIRESFAGEMGVWGAGSGHAALAWLRNAAGVHWELPVLVALAAGAWCGSRAAWGVALAALAADGLFSVFLNPMGQADLQTGMPGAWALSLALAHSAGHVRLSSWMRWIPMALGGGMVLASAMETHAQHQEDGLASRHGHAALLEPSPGAIAVLSSDHLAGQALYFQGIEGMRPDVVALVVQHLPDRVEVAHRYAQSGLEPPLTFMSTPREAQLAAVLALTRSEIERTGVWWEPGDGRFDPTLAEALRPGRFLYRLAPSMAAARAPLGALVPPGGDLMRRLGWGPAPTPALRSRRAMSDASRHRGVWHLLREEVSQGAVCLDEAVALDDTNTRALLNLAAARRRTGDLAGAITLLERTIALDPTYTKAVRNLDAYRAEVDGAEPSGTGAGSNLR